jgi:hypothetical protein
MPERICKYRITLYALAKGNPFPKKEEKYCPKWKRDGNEWYEIKSFK